MKKMTKLFGTLLIAGALVGFGAETVEAKKIYVGTNAEYKPYEYLENGKLVGFDIDLMNALAKELGYEIKYENMSFDGLIPALQMKKIDAIISGMTPTEQRKKAVDFTQVYYSTTQSILVNKNVAHEIKTPADLVGKKVGVQLGSIQEKIAEDLKAGEVVKYNSFTGGILDLKQDKIDAVIVGTVVADDYLANNPELEEAAIVVDSADGSAIAFGKGGEMVKEFDDAITKFKQTPEYTALVKKYFGEE